jgi:hypothetical protein
VDHLSAKLQQLLSSDGLPEWMAANAIKHVRQNYTWDRITDEFEAYYQALVAGEKISAPVESPEVAQPSLVEGNTRM